MSVYTNTHTATDQYMTNMLPLCAYMHMPAYHKQLHLVSVQGPREVHIHTTDIAIHVHMYNTYTHDMDSMYISSVYVLK